MKKKKSKNKWALVLSGGGANGMAHFPFLEFLEERDLSPDLIIGTSMGALLGGLFAAGVSSKSIKDIALNKFDPWDYFDISAKKGKHHGSKALAGIPGLSHKKGIIYGDQVESLLHELTDGILIEDCPIPFICNATDVQTAEEHLFTEGDLAYAIRCSISVPGLFHPVQHGEKLLVDGGLVSNLPIHVAHQEGISHILAIDASPQSFKKKKIGNVFDLLMRTITIELGRSGNLGLEKDEKTLLIRPVMDDIFFEFSKMKSSYEEGAKSLEENRERILDHLP